MSEEKKAEIRSRLNNLSSNRDSRELAAVIEELIAAIDALAADE